MTDSPLEQIDLLDTDYADILANSSHPPFELQLVRLGIDPAKARTATNFIALMRQKPDTPEGWAALTEAWEEACGFEPELEHLQLLVQLLWNNQRNDASDR
ncbi:MULTISPECIES: DUF4129 domain-containing protein [unclassified Microcoleus]|uniref:DUF4129 domain-containing protein n=1 Tax=unclassified Microcoleus TaxID=2642155 RepID=UPI002FD1BECF